MFYANLHLHSTFSDADFTPTQLVRIAKALGNRALALTDHETDGGCKEFLAAAAEEGIEAVRGTEFYGTVAGVNAHLTALDFDPDEPTLRELIRRRCELYGEYTRKCVERGIRLGIIQGITWEDVVQIAGEGAWLCIDSVYRAYSVKHIPAPENLRQDVFKGPEPRSFRPAHPTAEEVIRAVRKAGGVVGLAHPERQLFAVEELVGYGLNGIEINHPDISEETAQGAIEAAETFSLYRLGGTDHTGVLSSCGGKEAVFVDNGVDEEDYFAMKERRPRKK